MGYEKKGWGDGAIEREMVEAGGKNDLNARHVQVVSDSAGPSGRPPRAENISNMQNGGWAVLKAASGGEYEHARWSNVSRDTINWRRWTAGGGVEGGRG